jgi:hypothetical protein
MELYFNLFNEYTIKNPLIKREVYYYLILQLIDKRLFNSSFWE